jgi:hypothetical protein
MAKRQRGGARPGQRAPLQRGARPAQPPPAGRPAAPARPGGLSDDELARAAELEAQIVAEDRLAAGSPARRSDRRRPANGPSASGRPRTIGTLAAIADEEYVYVTRDLRKIAVVFAAIFGLLLASWLALTAGGIVAS